MFDPSNSQQTARYAVDAFIPYVLTIGATGGGPDRSQGTLIPDIEGIGFYVECADYPIMVSFVNASSGERQSIVLRDGVCVKGFFKGLYVTHPVLDQPATVKLILFRDCGKDIDYSNELATPVSRLGLAIFQVANSAAQQRYRIFVPQGVRALSLKAFIQLSTTVASGITDTLIFQRNVNGVPIFSPSEVQPIGGAPIPYTGQQYSGQAVSVNNISPGSTGAVTAWVCIDFGKTLLNSFTRDLEINIQGLLMVPNSILFQQMWE